ncbi:helicase associated domain-containing protein [Streptomyces violascens]|uniref:helicase associated domain-containing protein n=1 Tax=Streptomyces violascens TaxID=67381 RepID=UPI00227D8DEC|nr:helicase associated domain-containing protein [Streptomyces violascens]
MCGAGPPSSTSASGASGSPWTARTTNVRLGVWVSHQKSRRDKLNADQLAQLAELGLDWARDG